MEFRELEEYEINQIWDIDRTEYVDAIYILKSGKLEEKKINQTFYGWPPNEDKIYGPILKDCYKRNGYFLGGFCDGKLKAVVILESKWIGAAKDTLQLKFLHIDQSLRKTGIGRILFEKAVGKARELQAKRIYISSCENKNTVEFYRHMGCEITKEVDKDLYALEPEDIQMDLTL